jgi:hypothetical protein
MAFNLNMWELPKRKAEIQNVKSGTNHGSFPLIFRGDLEDFPIYKVSVDMPVYRLANGRTIARQREYIANNKKIDNFFNLDPESIEALEAQHVILSDMVKDEGLYAYFGEINTVQDEPLVLDENGYVINGNRRLCAMRLLINKDPIKYKKYNFIRVIFLHSYNEEDIIRLEAQLQIKRDIKAKYSWITEALMYRNHLNQGLDYKGIQSLYDKKKLEIERLVDMAVDVDAYLISRDIKDQYSRVEFQEHVFKELRKSRKKFKDTQDKELFTQLVFQFLDDPDDVPGRFLIFVKDIADNLSEIKETLNDEFTIPDAPPVSVEPEDDDLGLLKPKTGIKKPKVVQAKTAMINFVKSGKEAEDVRENVADTVDLSKKRKKETKTKKAFINNLKKSYTFLVDAKNLHSEDSITLGATKYIENIENLIEVIKGKLG